MNEILGPRCSVITEKLCRSCSIIKPVYLFSLHEFSSDGYKHDCKACRRKVIEKIKKKDPVSYEPNYQGEA